jgi:hypothetical protein
MHFRSLKVRLLGEPTARPDRASQLGNSKLNRFSRLVLLTSQPANDSAVTDVAARETNWDWEFYGTQQV